MDAALLLSRTHPYGVSPRGNMWSAGAAVNGGSSRAVASRVGGLGARMSVLSDSTLLDVLSMLGGSCLAQLSGSSRFAYALAHHDGLWRNLVLSHLGDDGELDYRGSWKETFTRTFGGAACGHVPLCCGVFSDALYQSFWCSASTFPPRWTEIDNVPREDARTLTVEDFVTKYELPNRPVILEHSLDEWGAYSNAATTATRACSNETHHWTHDYLVRTAGNATFNSGGHKFSLARYFQYAHVSHDDNPLYLFDKHFVCNTPQFGLDYSPLPYFSRERDLFEVLAGTGYRPDHRWLIVGPARSGSRFHVDPNGTSAWNAVVSGAKKWVMFPPHIVPPGVHPSADGGDVTSPVSLMEWFRGFYDAAREDGTMVEGVCRAGETIFVPAGWWHLVVNLEFSVAVTQNYVSTSNLASVLNFLARSPKHVSGLPHGKRPHLRRRFLEELERRRPSVFADYKAKREEREAASRTASEKKRKNKGAGLMVGSWHSLTVVPEVEVESGQYEGTECAVRQPKRLKKAEIKEEEAEGGGAGFRFSFF